MITMSIIRSIYVLYIPVRGSVCPWFSVAVAKGKLKREQRSIIRLIVASIRGAGESWVAFAHRTAGGIEKSTCEVCTKSRIFSSLVLTTSNEFLDIVSQGNHTDLFQRKVSVVSLCSSLSPQTTTTTITTKLLCPRWNTYRLPNAQADPRGNTAVQTAETVLAVNVLGRRGDRHV